MFSLHKKAWTDCSRKYKKWWSLEAVSKENILILDTKPQKYEPSDIAEDVINLTLLWIDLSKGFFLLKYLFWFHSMLLYENLHEHSFVWFRHETIVSNG